jgi:superfamily II DNA or RNA helicase
MGIDDLADRTTRRRSPGERFEEDWLSRMPESQWPPYIDETARLVADGIVIGETDLTTGDFSFETARSYRRGLAVNAGIDLSETSLPIGEYPADVVGTVCWVFNRLHAEIDSSATTNFENPSRAIEAGINKAVVERSEDDRVDPGDLEMIRLPRSAGVSTLVAEVFCRPRSPVYLDLLLDVVEDSERSGGSLLERIDEPRMITRLWDHQREALEEWLAGGCRGYVEMATATGKTVLGLAAVAHHFGALHPADRDLAVEAAVPEGERATVTVVAHRDLILDQWKREFDTHLNVPQQRSTSSGASTVEFEWGEVNFWTPNRLREHGVPESDLVVLDETHHYLGNSGFGRILDEIEGHVLALSGSIDPMNARTLERRDIPERFEFTLRDGQAAGVIPTCDWNVVFTPYGDQSKLVEATEACRTGFERYGDGLPATLREAVGGGRDVSFETLSEARSLVQSSLGKELKEADPRFREFASAVMGRQLTRYNLSPSLSTVVGLTVDHVDRHKCIVLLESEDEVRAVTDRLRSELGEAYDSLVTVVESDAEESLGAIREFDDEREVGALVGIAGTLGEGVDVRTADVAINRGRGRLSRSLVQRMGRVLRNPDGDKHAQFFHVMGVPTREEAIVPHHDGPAFLETASQLISWGESFHARPVFDVDEGNDRLSANDVARLEREGVAAIESPGDGGYSWPADEDIRSTLERLVELVGDASGSALLGIERQERPDVGDEPEPRAGPDVEGGPEPPSPDPGVAFVAADGGGLELADRLHGLLAAAADRSGRDVDALLADAVRRYAREVYPFPNPDERTVPSGETRHVAVNPALEAVLSAYAESPERRTLVVHEAVARYLADSAPELLTREGITADGDVLQQLSAERGGGR